LSIILGLLVVIGFAIATLDFLNAFDIDLVIVGYIVAIAIIVFIVFIACIIAYFIARAGHWKGALGFLLAITIFVVIWEIVIHQPI
jgi:hypothetical protein